MALNGLDSAKVKQAYETALVDPDSWFLIHYLSRDQVTILGQGTSGFEDLRARVITYPEKSPLYGFFTYHQSRVLFKYIPEGTSRLLQVRTNVHFEAVMEYFTNFDTLVTVEKPADFNKFLFWSACFPDAAPLQTSNSHSDKGDDDDDDDALDEDDGFVTTNGNITPMQRTSEKRQIIYGSERSGPSSQFSASEDAHSVAPQIETKAASSVIHQYDPTTASEQETDDDVIRDLPCVEDDVASLTSSYVTYGRHGESSEYVHRDSGSDYLNRSMENFEQLRPKVKLFPRPVTNVRATRAGGEGAARAKLPAGLRRPNAKADRKHSRSSKPSKSPKDGKSPISQRSRRNPAAFRHPSIEIGEDFPTLEDAEPASVQESSPAASASAPASQHTDLQESVSREADSEISYDHESVSPTSETRPPPQAMAPNADFALLPRRPATGVGVPKPWMTRESSYGDSTFSVLSTEKQRLMRVLELRKKTLTPLTTSGESSIPVREPSAEHTVGGQAQESTNEHGTRPSTSLSNTTTTYRQRTPSMDYVHGLTPRLPQSLLSINPDLQVMPGHSESSSRDIDVSLTPSKAELAAEVQSNSDGNTHDEETPRAGATEKRARKASREKRRANIEPIQIGSFNENHDDESDSDDSFMKELQNAKVEEAKPMSFAQSPRSPLFSSDRGDLRLTSGSVTSVMIHSPSRTSLRQNVPESVIGRSPLETIPYEMMGEDTPSGRESPTASATEPVTFPSQLSSIPDEEQHSEPGLDRVPVTSVISTSEPQQLYEQDQKQEQQQLDSQTRDVHEQGALDPQVLAESQMANTASKRPRQANALLKDAVHTFYNVTRLTKAQPPREQSSVTKIERKIIPNMRKGRQAPPQADATESQAPREPTSLPEQPLAQEGKVSRAFPNNGLPRTRPLPQPAPPKPKPKVFVIPRRKSVSAADAPVVADQTNKLQRKISNQAKPNQSSTTAATAATAAPPGVRVPASEVIPPHDPFIKQMSVIRATTQHPPSQQQAEYLRDQNRASSWPQIAPPAVSIGAPEVQLPDTLLWKHRDVEVDGSGFLAVGNTVEEGTRVLPRKYRMSEFKVPFAPGQDRQEVPFSIVFERSEGGSLQFAFNDARGQTLALRKLVNLHRAWVAFGQK